MEVKYVFVGFFVFSHKQNKIKGYLKSNQVRVKENPARLETSDSTINIILQKNTQTNTPNKYKGLQLKKYNKEKLIELGIKWFCRQLSADRKLKHKEIFAFCQP